MLNNFIVYGLSLLLLTASFHIESHHNDHSDGYSICNIDCDDEKHHSITHQCEKCLNKNNRLIVQECVELSFNGNGIFFYSLNDSFDNALTYFNLFSRPPPALL